MGGLIVAVFEKLKEQGFVALCTLIGLGASIVGFALSRWLPLSCLLIFVSGVAIMASASLMLSLVQLIVSDQMRGRVMSVYNLAFRLGIPVGSLALGKVIPIIGVAPALAISGGLQPGQAFHTNYATSYEVMKNVRLGFNGYWLQQLTDHRIDGTDLPNSKEWTVGLGPGIQFAGKGIWFRVNSYLETDVRNRASGTKVTFRISKTLGAKEPNP